MFLFGGMVLLGVTSPGRQGNRTGVLGMAGRKDHGSLWCQVWEEEQAPLSHHLGWVPETILGFSV